MPNTLRIKRRAGGGSAGAPSSLANAELAYNESDAGNGILYYGLGTGGAGGSATSVIAIGGAGAYVSLTGNQTTAASLAISGNKDFTGTVSFGANTSGVTAATADNTTKLATTAFVKAQGYGTGSVTSVGLSLPSFITVSNSPVTGTGTLTGTLANQTANTVFVAPDGAAGAPTFRALLAADIPTLTAAKISNFDTQVRTSRLDQMAVPTASLDINSQRLTNVATPLLPTDGCNKQYADSISQSLNVHGAAQYATTGAVSYTFTSGGNALTITTITGTDTITFSGNHALDINSQIRTGNTTTGTGLTANTTYYVTTVPSTTQVKVSATYGGANATLTNGTSLNIGVTGDPGENATLSGCPNTLDGSSTFVGGERILVKDHTTSAYNGVYVVTTVGTGANGVWTRSTDFDNGPTGEITQGDYVFVSSGTVNGSNGFVQTATTPIRMGINAANYSAFTGDNITFSQFSGAGQITAGAGLTKSGNTLDVASTGGGSLTINADSINLTSGIATAGTYRSVTVDTYGRVTAGTTPTTFSGYGISDSSANLFSALTDKSGTAGLVVFSTSPSLTTPTLSGETFSTTNNVTAGTNAQGQGALTSDYNVITTAAANPSGVTLPTATQGRRIVIVNKGANPVNVYPATGGTIDALAANAAISLAVNGVMEFNASSTTQWYSSYNLTNVNAGVTSFSAGTTGLTPSTGTTGAITLAGTLNVANGGTGLATLSGLAYGNGTSAFSAATGAQIATAIGTTTITNASNAVNTGITNDAATATAVYPTWVTANTGNLPQNVTSTRLSFVPSTGILTATGFAGSGSSLTSLSASNISAGILSSTYGGTGVNNGGSTITVGGNLAFSGAFATTITVTAATSVTLPASGIILSDGSTIDGGTF